MLKEDIIEPATTERASSIVFAAKKDGSLRICVNYQKLNAIIIRYAYQLSCMNEYIDVLQDVRILSTLDAKFDYWQVEIDKRDCGKTTCTSLHGFYQFG